MNSPLLTCCAASLLLLLLLLHNAHSSPQAFGLDDDAPVITRRMMHGSQALQSGNSAPWIAALVDERDAEYCVASLIRPRWLLTSAACTRVRNQHTYTVLLCQQLEACAQRRTYNDSDVFEHPGYESGPAGSNNIALIRMDRRVVLVSFLNLPLRRPPPGATLSMFSWGLTSMRVFARSLQQAATNVRAAERCPAPVPRNAVCAVSDTARLCLGDFGSPLVNVEEHTIYGVLGRIAPGCATGQAWYEFVGGHLDWILSVIDGGEG